VGFVFATSALCAYLPAQPLAAEAAQDQTRREEVVATFDGGKITVGELENAILERNPFMQQRYVSRDAVHSMLESNLRFKLLALEAQRRGYERNAAAVLAQNQSAVQTLIKQDFDDKITPQSLSEADIRKYYDAHKDEFMRGEGRRASVLWVRDAAAGNAVLARAKAADLRAFRELVRSESIDQSTKQRGGDLSYFDANGRLFDEDNGAIDPGIAKAAFGLHNIGDTTDVVAFGEFHAIVRLTGIEPAQNESFTQAEQRLRMRLWREQRQAAIDAHLDVLKRQLNVRVHPELVDVVQLDTGPALPPSTGLPSGFPHIPPETPPATSHTGPQPR
jgi:parvulin-like peptidyl-prolyl isomerase